MTESTGDQVADQYIDSKTWHGPAIQRLLTVLAEGRSRSVSDAMVQAGINPGSTSIRRRLMDGGDLREDLLKQLEEKNLSLPRVLQKLSDKMDAQKTLIVKGPKGSTEAISTDDNDAQLRATEQVIKLHDRTGKLPAQSESGGGAGSITVNVLVMSDKPDI